MNKVLYLTCASRMWGMGHLRRSQALLKCLKETEENIVSLALVPKEDQNLFSKEIELFDSIGKYKTFLAAENSFPMQQRRYSKRSEEFSCNVVTSLDQIKWDAYKGAVVDVHTDLQNEVCKFLEEAGYPVVAIDWYKDDFKHLTKVNLRGGKKSLQYAIIRDEFLKVQEVLRSRVPEYDIVVSLGARDLRGYFPKIIKALNGDGELKSKKVLFIPSSLTDGSLTDLTKFLASRFEVKKDPLNIAELMKKARIGITNGGTTLMEFSYLGVPTLVFPQSQEEDHFIQTFIDNGGSLRGVEDPEGFCNQLKGLFDDVPLRQHMAQRARDLVDGQGVKRISEIVLKTFNV